MKIEKIYDDYGKLKELEGDKHEWFQSKWIYKGI